MCFGFKKSGVLKETEWSMTTEIETTSRFDVDGRSDQSTQSTG